MRSCHTLLKVADTNRIFDYVVNKRYSDDLSKSEKRNVRRASDEQYMWPVVGSFFYRHRANRNADEYVELQVIRDEQERRQILNSIHSGSDQWPLCKISSNCQAVLEMIHGNQIFPFFSKKIRGPN